MATKWWSATIVDVDAAKRRELGVFGGQRAAKDALIAATEGKPGRIIRRGLNLTFMPDSKNRARPTSE